MKKHYDPSSFESQKSLGYLLKTNHALMREGAERILAKFNFNFVHWIILQKLHEGLVNTASDLCREIAHDNGAITRVIDQLEDKGLIERIRSLQDRRVVNLTLTDAGRNELNQLTPAVIDCLNNVLAPFSDAEFLELIRLLEKLRFCFQSSLNDESCL